VDGRDYQGSVKIKTDGTWEYWRGDSQTTGTLLGTSSGHAASASAWIYVEIKVFFHGSTGTVDIHVDGNSVLALTSQNTAPTTNLSCSNIAFQGSSGGGDHTQLDDIYMLDTSGSLNNTFLGPVNIKVLWATSDGGTNQFTPDSGTNHYDRVTDNPQDTTTYLEDGTAGDKELFGVTNLNLATIAGIQMNTVAKLTDQTSLMLKSSVHTGGGTDSEDAGLPVATADYQTFSRVLETNPETSVPWTQTALNASKFGFKLG
jgi:hypothetical protein